jgi:hypothetical protein
MSDTNTGGPAFPLQSIGPDFAPGYSGMTLRDYFAAKAMQGLIGGDWPTAKSEQNQLALLAYSVADAMLKARDAK